MKQYILIFAFALSLFAGSTCDLSSCDSIQPTLITQYVGIGAAFYDTKDLNEALELQGVDSFHVASFHASFGEKYHFIRFIVDGGGSVNIWRFANNATRRALLASGEMQFSMGYDLIERAEVSLYPFGGLAVGATCNQLSYESIPYDEIASGAAPSDQIVINPYFALKTGLGFEFHPKNEKRAAVVGLRTGFTFDISKDDEWYREFATISGAPSFRHSGAFIEFIVGVVKDKSSLKKCD